MTSHPDQITKLCLTVLLLCGVSLANGQTGAERITTASGVRLRTAPQTRADEVTRLPLGAVVQVQEQSPGKEKIGQSEDFWYRVTTADSKSGWMFGSFSAPFEPAQRETIYQRIAAERLKVEQANFAELSDLVNFLTRAATETTTPAVTAELELSRLLALGRSLLNLSQTNAEAQAQHPWVKAHEKEIIYSEPGGLWLVRSEMFRDLQKKYRALPIADRIAWEAVKNGLPGECEGYLPCSFERLLLGEGKYLELYPQGAHAAEAIGNIDEMLKFIIEDSQQQKISEVPREDRPQFRKQIAQFRALILKTGSPNKAAILKRLDQVARLFP
ncbi:MAG: SH3 domain-containing protein [Blastocatellia bacterium]